MTEWISLIQTLVWPAFVLALMVWRRQEVGVILAAIAERIKEGAAIEFPGGKIGEKPKPLDLDNQYDKLKNAVENALKTVIAPDQLKNTITKVEEGIKQEAFLTVDATVLLPNVEPWTVPYDRFGTVSALLNDIWATIRRLGYDAPNLSFGTLWVLEVAGRRLTQHEIGIQWARKKGKGFDDRLLSDPAVGIKPGMQLRVVPA